MLAGESAVALYDSLLRQQLITEHADQVSLTGQGIEFYQHCQVDFSKLNSSARPLCKTCLDWSERRSHLAGALGHWILADLLARAWAQRQPDSRVICFSPQGLAAFRRRYGIKD